MTGPALRRPTGGAWEVPLRAVIFDMDGVLVDSEPIHQEAAEALLASVGLVLREEVYLQCVGTTARRTYDILTAAYDLPWSFDDYQGAYEVEILSRLRRPLDRLPGVGATIEAVERRGLGLALASSSRFSWIEATLEGLGLTGRFPVVASGQEVVHGKPSPEIFLLAAERLGIEPGACLVFEDSPAGVAASSGAGMRTVAVRTAYTARLALPGADIIVDSLEDLPDEFFD